MLFRSSQIMNLHQYAHDFVKKPIHVKDTLAIARAIRDMDIAPSKIDVGKLAFEWDHEKSSSDLQSFLNKKLADFIGVDKKQLIPRDVVLYGFGRIGRILARELVAQAGKGEQLRLKAIVVRSRSEDEIGRAHV